MTHIYLYLWLTLGVITLPKRDMGYLTKTSVLRMENLSG